MSYCRVGVDSDVYVYPARDGIVCCGCKITPKVTGMYPPDVIKEYDLEDKPFTYHPDFTTVSRYKIIEHLLEHRTKGETVPERVFDRLKSEIERLGDYY